MNTASFIDFSQNNVVTEEIRNIIMYQNEIREFLLNIETQIGTTTFIERENKYIATIDINERQLKEYCEGAITSIEKLKEAYCKLNSMQKEPE